MTTRPLRVLLADDHPILREGLRSFLASCPGIEIVGEAADGLQAVQLAVERMPDVVLMDVAMPGLDGLEATRQLRSAAPSAKVLLLTVSAEPEYLREGARAGACGYLLKDAAPAALLRALEAVHAGGPFHTSGSADALRASAAAKARDGAARAVALSERERDVLVGILAGRTSREIAGRLALSVRTVESHRARLRRKLGARSPAELARRAFELGLAAPDKGTAP